MLLLNKELSKAIMAIIFLQNKGEENRKLYAKQRNFCSPLLRKNQKEKWKLKWKIYHW